MSLSPIDIAADVVAGALAASKLLSAAQPLWSKLPRWFAVVLPVLVMDIPQVVTWFGGVQTGTGLTAAVITSLALLLPGVAEAEMPAPAAAK